MARISSMASRPSISGWKRARLPIKSWRRIKQAERLIARGRCARTRRLPRTKEVAVRTMPSILNVGRQNRDTEVQEKHANEDKDRSATHSGRRTFTSRSIGRFHGSSDEPDPGSQDHFA